MNKLFILVIICCQSLWGQQLQGQVIWQNKKYDVDSLVPQAVNYLREGKLEQSILLSRTVLSIYPKYTDFSYILGMSYQKMGRNDWAIPYFESVIATDADYRDAYLSLASLYEVRGEISKAGELWRRAITRFHQDTAFYAAYQAFEARKVGYFNDQRTVQWYQEGQKSIAQGDAKRTLDYSDSIRHVSPDDKRYLYLRTSAYMFNKEYDKAKADYELLLSRGDTSVFIREQLANIAAANKDYRLALQYIEQLRAAQPQPERYRQLAQVYRENLPYEFYLGVNHLQSAQDRPNGHFFISGLEYGQKIGEKDVLVSQFNYGNRRGAKGYQVALDAWVNYTANLYAYHHLAWADGSVFPNWRAAYSLYREAGVWLFDIGGRYIRTVDQTNNYGGVASFGRYFGTTFVYLRGFLLHDEQRWNQAYSLSVRHYYNPEKPNSYVTLIGNMGTSPDDPSRYQLLNNSFGFLSRSVNAGWQHRIDSWGFTLMGGWTYYKIAENTFINQYDLNLSLRKYF
ncbi:YaiO family outer membrane beta-barrel protein [Sphingobacterium thalpophilum]|uniref:YaiO family outer membrane beta-barrel protein n=1 Tax=Sphingobacterium thalpophilum TaxID=259 RepID=UPI0031E4801A